MPKKKKKNFINALVINTELLKIININTITF
jgi:hypothetical protein